MRGWVSAKYNLTPTEARFRELNIVQLEFLQYWKRKVEEEQYERFESILGTLWDRVELTEMLKEMGKPATGNKSRKVRIPLALALKPELLDFLKQLAGKGKGSIVMPSDAWVGLKDKKFDEVVEAGGLDKQSFLDLIYGIAPDKIAKKEDQ